jgi:pimeloyl-ACP methyl ester carboxylesterase
MRRHALVLIALFTFVLASPATAMTVDGAAPGSAAVCGAERAALLATAGQRLTVRPDRGGRHALDRARCAGRRWQPLGRARRADGPTQVGPLAAGGYRLTLRRRNSRRVLARRYVHVAERVATTPVEFRVRNVNRSALPCPADGREYTLHGHLVAPARGTPRAVTLYLHEFGFRSGFWRDHARALAEAGHASVVVDRLGYAPSDRPAGNDVCLGSHADMAHQVVERLRERFARVMLAGHSAGGGIAELAAHSFGGVDALLLFGWADQGYANATVQTSVVQGATCLQGGDEPGYAFYSRSREDFEALNFHDAEPGVIERAWEQYAPDPCGDNASVAQISVVNGAGAGSIDVPVLLVFGEHDAVFQPGADEQQAEAFEDSTLVRIPRAGHAVALERSAPLMHAAVARWLAEREG